MDTVWEGAADLRASLVPITDVSRFPGNPRRGDVEAIAKSLRRFGQQRTALVQRGTGLIVAGNHLRDAAELLGWTHVAVTMTDLDDTEARAYLVADNQIPTRGQNDADAMAAFMADLQARGAIDDALGFDSEDLDRYLNAPGGDEAADDAPDAPEPKDVYVRPGDLWTLGDHRLYVGDAARAESYDALLGGDRVQMVWTDPPYGVEVTGGTADHLTIANDEKDAVALRLLLDAALTLAVGRLEPGRAVYVAAPGGDMTRVFLDVLCGLGVYRQTIVWVKDCLSATTPLYARTQTGDGSHLLGELVTLDPATVQLWNGQRWTQVRAWSRARDQQGYAVTVGTGETVTATAEHRWPTLRGLVATRDLIVGDVIETARLPEPDPIRSPEYLPDSEIGWFVGMYLAEGSPGDDNHAHMTLHADEIATLFPRIKAIAEGLGGSATAYARGKRGVVNIHGYAPVAVLRTYLSGRVAKDKRLASPCWRRSDAFLRSLLEGYLAGDGHYDAKNDRWRLGFTRNDRLAANLRTLCARIGVPIRLVRATATGFGKDDWPIYRGDLRLAPTAHWNARKAGRVVAVEALARAQQFWDVEVADDPHTFALASGLLTHNSLVLGRSDYHWRHELVHVGQQPPAKRKRAKEGSPVHYGWRPGAAHFFIADRTLDSVWEIPRPRRSAEHPCLPPDEIVLTERGWVSIGDVAVGDRVLAHTGFWEPVSDVTRHPHDGDLIEIAVEASPQATRTTSNHPYLISRRGEVGWVDAADVQVGDSTLTPVIDSLPWSDTDAERAWAVGLWAAEGSTLPAGHGSNYYLVWTLHNDEQAMADRLRALYPGLRSYRNGENAQSHMLFDPVEAARYVSLVGKGARAKWLSPDVLEWNSDAREALLQGYLDGDGWRLRREWRAKTASRDLATSIQMLAEGLGRSTSVRRYESAGSLLASGRRIRGGTYYDVTVSDLPRRTVDHDGTRYVLRRVKAVGRVPYTGDVVNLTVEAAHTFQTVAGMTHNTMKPAELVERSIVASSRRGDTVLDPFAGSGTTLIAAERSHRKARVMEIDPQYATVIVDRWANYTGREPTLDGATREAVRASRRP